MDVASSFCGVNSVGCFEIVSSTWLSSLNESELKRTSFKAGHGPRRSSVCDVLKVHIAGLLLGKVMPLQLPTDQVVVVEGSLALLRRDHELVLRLAEDGVVVSGGSGDERVAALAALQGARAGHACTLKERWFKCLLHSPELGTLAQPDRVLRYWTVY